MVALSMIVALAASQARAQESLIIKEIIIRGNTLVSPEVIKTQMRAKEGSVLIISDLERDETSLKNLGFFKDVKIFSRPLNSTEAQIVVDVEENPLVKEISIMGNTAVPTKEILQLVTQQVGQVLNFNTRKTTADAIRELYSKKGFFVDVDFPTMDTAPETLVILVVEGTVNDIIVTGLSKTKPQVIDRLLKTERNKPFNVKTWLNDRRRLESTQWFEQVKVSDRPTNELGRFDLLLDVKEQRTAIFDVGVALDTRSRLAGTIKVRDTNFRGMGQSIGANYVQDTFGSGASLSVDYGDPFFGGRDTNLGIALYSKVSSYFTNFGGGSQISNDDRFDERRNGGSISLSRGYKEVYATTFGASFENISSINKSTTASEFIQQDGTLAKFILQASMDRRDVPLDPFQGIFARVAVEPGFSNISKIGGSVASFTDILGSKSFLKTTMEYKGFFSRQPKGKAVDAPRPVLATRAKIVSTTGVVPFYEQVFAGGADSIRGYPEQRFWGKHALLTTAELRLPIQSNFSVIPFVDYGGAWGGYKAIKNYKQSQTLRMNLGYGAGVAFRTPLGAIRIDFGFTPRGESKTHFSIGGSF